MFSLLDKTFTWDEPKSKENLKKHGLALSEAVPVFCDPFWLSFMMRRILPLMNHAGKASAFSVMRCCFRLFLLKERTMDLFNNPVGY
jgi:uncharacterized DUF497 family protein